MQRWLWLLLVSASVASQQTNQSPDPPTLEIPHIVGEIEIDGDLDDPGWQDAARVTDFTQCSPVDNVKPSVETEVLVVYNDSYLYLAFVCYDDPGSIRATLTDRDRMYSDDFIGIILDTYGDAAWAYEFYVNPLGVQGDLRWLANGDEDWRFDLVYETAGRITETGWQAEMAIPFSSLHFPNDDEHIWRATFWRSHPRDNVYKYSWAPLKIGEPCFFCQFGHLTGIRNVKPGSKLDLLPSVIGYQSGMLSDPDDLDSRFDNTDPDAEVALNARYQITPGLTAEAAINPDFSQVESDAAQIDVNTTFALSYPERRPFFQKGSDLYDTFLDAIYTRSVNNPDAAFKLTGRMNRMSFFYLLAHDENTPCIVPLEEQSAFVPFENSVSNVARVRRTILEDSHVGALVTDRRIKDGVANTVFGPDISIRFLKNYRLEFQALASNTKEPNNAELSEDYLPDTTFDDGAYTVAFDGESFDGHALYASIERDARLWNFDIDLCATSPTFRADNGFIVRNGSRSVEGWTGLFFRPNGKVVTRITPQLGFGRVWDYLGTRKDEWLTAELCLHLAKQTHFHPSFVLSRERWHGVWFDDIRRVSVNIDNDMFDVFRPGVYLSYGNTIARNVDPLPVMGRATNVSLCGTIKPLQQLTIEPSVDYLKLNNRDTGEKIHEGSVIRTRLNYQFTRELFVRTIVQYDDFDNDLRFEPLVTYKLNPYTIFYIGSTHSFWYELGKVHYPEKSERQFFLKFQYLFRV